MRKTGPLLALVALGLAVFAAWMGSAGLVGAWLLGAAFCG